MNFFSKSLRIQAILTISLVMTIIIAILIIVIPNTVREHTEKSTLNIAINYLDKFKLLRAYYTDNVVKKVLLNSDITTSHNHLNSQDKIPLPATMIHDLSKLYEKKGTTFTLYSAFPFPNRKDRQLDAFQLQAWRDLQVNPNKIVKKIVTTNEQVVLRVAISDQMQVQACVDCHNNHPLTPKNDWRLKDVRGVLETQLDITPQLELANTLSMYIIISTVIAAIVLIIVSFLLFSRLTRLFSDVSQNMIRIGKGDFEAELSYHSDTNEFEQMAIAFSLFKSTILEREGLVKQKQLFEKEKITSLGQMMATIVHDVNTPLGVSQTAVTCLQDGINKVEAQLLEGNLTKSDLDTFISLCDNSSVILLRNLNNAIELLNSFKQVTVDQVSEKARKINLSEYFESVIHSLQPKTQKAGVTIHFECSPNCYIYTFPGSLAQVVTNLINNSIIHGFGEQQGGNIIITITCENDDDIHLHYSDDGVGISEEDLPKVMNIFFTTKQNEGGSGLGLNIVQEIVTLKLNGTIEINSKLGEGLHFDIYFPRVNNQKSGEE
jgi:signal transduction histidine kinase